MEGQAGTLGISPGELQALLSDYSDADTAYPIGELRWDAAGNLWVGRRDSMPFGGQPKEYDVFTPGGRPLGVVEVPNARRSRILEIGRDYVLLETRDDLDVPFLAVHSLVETR